jgi:hypothetical protein
MIPWWKTESTLNEPKVTRYDSFDILPYIINRPSIQRDIIPESVLNMREHIKFMFEKKCTPIFGMIYICILDKVAYVVDGQHRLKALEDEWNETKIPIPFFLMEYYVVDKIELEFIFKILNSGITIPNFLLSEEIEVKKRDLLKDIQVLISKRKLFVFKEACNRPYVSIIEFMDHLSKSILFDQIWDTYSETDNPELVDYFNGLLDNANKQIEKLSSNPSWLKRNKISDKMLEQCKINNSYFGLTMDRLYFAEFFIGREPK